MIHLFSNPHAIRIQTTSEGGLTEFEFNLDWLNVNSVWIQLMRINSHSCTLFLSCGQALYTPVFDMAILIVPHSDELCLCSSIVLIMGLSFKMMQISFTKASNSKWT